MPPTTPAVSAAATASFDRREHEVLKGRTTLWFNHCMFVAETPEPRSVSMLFHARGHAQRHAPRRRCVREQGGTKRYITPSTAAPARELLPSSHRLAIAARASPAAGQQLALGHVLQMGHSHTSISPLSLCVISHTSQSHCHSSQSHDQPALRMAELPLGTPELELCCMRGGASIITSSSRTTSQPRPLPQL